MYWGLGGIFFGKVDETAIPVDKIWWFYLFLLISRRCASSSVYAGKRGVDGGGLGTIVEVKDWWPFGKIRNANGWHALSIPEPRSVLLLPTLILTTTLRGKDYYYFLFRDEDSRLRKVEGVSRSLTDEWWGCGHRYLGLSDCKVYALPYCLLVMAS